MDASCFFLESLKYIYLYHSSETIQIPAFSWSGLSKCTWVTQGTAILHLFPGVAQVKFFWVQRRREPSRAPWNQCLRTLSVNFLLYKMKEAGLGLEHIGAIEVWKFRAKSEGILLIFFYFFCFYDYNE
jgi:hypothetical protein